MTNTFCSSNRLCFVCSDRFISGRFRIRSSNRLRKSRRNIDGVALKRFLNSRTKFGPFGIPDRIRTSLMGRSVKRSRSRAHCSLSCIEYCWMLIPVSWPKTTFKRDGLRPTALARRPVRQPWFGMQETQNPINSNIFRAKLRAEHRGRHSFPYLKCENTSIKGRRQNAAPTRRRERRKFPKGMTS
jgi:hypothetical protein